MTEFITYTCNCSDYSSQLAEISDKLDTLVSLLGTMEGFALFAVVVVLCIFVYKFFRMFF